EVVRDTVRELADDVGGGRSNEQQIHAGRERDVLDVGVHPRCELGGDDRLARDGFEGYGTDEARGRARHDRLDAVTALLQQSGYLDRLVGADAASDAEADEGHGNRLLSLGRLGALDRACGDLLQGAAGRLRRAVDLGQAALQQLTRARRGDSHEFKRVIRSHNWLHLVRHYSAPRNVLTMGSTPARRRIRLARSAVTIAHNSPTHLPSSSLITT